MIQNENTATHPATSVSLFRSTFAAMKQIALLSLLFFTAVAVHAQNTVIDASGNNTSSSYITYDKAISVAAGKTVDVKMARYCYLTSTVSGKGTINLYAGGERGYLGTKSGASWANWTNFKGDAHIYPFKENSPSAGSFNTLIL